MAGQFVMLPVWLLRSGCSARALRLYATLQFLARHARSLHVEIETLIQLGCGSNASIRRALNELRGLKAIATAFKHRAKDGAREGLIVHLAGTVGPFTLPLTGEREDAAAYRSSVSDMGKPTAQNQGAYRSQLSAVPSSDQFLDLKAAATLRPHHVETCGKTQPDAPTFGALCSLGCTVLDDAAMLPIPLTERELEDEMAARCRATFEAPVALEKIRDVLRSAEFRRVSTGKPAAVPGSAAASAARLKRRAAR